MTKKERNKIYYKVLEQRVKYNQTTYGLCFQLEYLTNYEHKPAYGDFPEMNLLAPKNNWDFKNRFFLPKAREGNIVRETILCLAMAMTTE